MLMKDFGLQSQICISGDKGGTLAERYAIIMSKKILIV